MCVSMSNERLIVVVAAVLLLLLGDGDASARDEEGCLFCHRLSLGGQPFGTGGAVDFRVADPAGIVHSPLFCSDCHRDVSLIPHATTLSPARCIDACHADVDTAPAQARHRAASFGGLTESHRKVSAPTAPCRLCHGSTDAKGDRVVVSARCAGCHPGKGAALSVDHSAETSKSGGCVACHRAHGDGSAALVPHRCGDCHGKVDKAMADSGGHKGAAVSGPFRSPTVRVTVVGLLASLGFLPALLGAAGGRRKKEGGR